MKDAISLHEARAERRLTPRDVAAALDVAQANVSRVERQDDLYLSKLEECVAALGGHLELHAVFRTRRSPWSCDDDAGVARRTRAVSARPED